MFVRLGKLKGRAIEIPAPAVSEVADYGAIYSADFKLPSFFIRHRGRAGLGVDEDTDRTGSGAQAGTGAACLQLVSRRLGAPLAKLAPASATCGARSSSKAGCSSAGGRWCHRKSIPPPPYTAVQRRVWDMQQGSSGGALRVHGVRINVPVPAGGASGGHLASGAAAPDNMLVDYNLTVEDEEWLRHHPKYGENGDPRFKLADDTFERMLDLLEKATAWGAPVALVDAEALFVCKLRLHRSAGNKVVPDVHAYWKSRRSRLRKPLLRAFWPATSVHDTNPHMVFRPREKERYRLRRKRGNDVDSLRKMSQLSRELTLALNLLFAVQGRENLRLDQLNVWKDEFEQFIHDVSVDGVERTPREPLVKVLTPPVKGNGLQEGTRRGRWASPLPRRRAVELELVAASRIRAHVGNVERSQSGSHSERDKIHGAAAAASCRAVTQTPVHISKASSTLPSRFLSQWHGQQTKPCNKRPTRQPLPLSHLARHSFVQGECTAQVDCAGGLVGESTRCSTGCAASGPNFLNFMGRNGRGGRKMIDRRHGYACGEILRQQQCTCHYYELLRDTLHSTCNSTS